MNVEFISYDGKYPNLCSGTLKLKVNNKLYALSHVLVSGGCVNFSSYDEDEVSKGPWTIDLSQYKELEPYKEEIAELVNENVSQGCCGGCL